MHRYLKRLLCWLLPAAILLCSCSGSSPLTIRELPLPEIRARQPLTPGPEGTMLPGKLPLLRLTKRRGIHGFRPKHLRPLG